VIERAKKIAAGIIAANARPMAAALPADLRAALLDAAALLIEMAQRIEKLEREK
jgi:hypothetical protein